MRILYWTESFWPHIGGVQVLSLPLIRALMDKGHRFLVVTSHGRGPLPDQELVAGIEVRRFHFQGALADRSLASIRDLAGRVAELKRTFRPDLIHIHSCEPGLFFHLHTLGAGVAPVLFSLHGVPASVTEGNSLLGRALRSAHWVAACSAAVLEDILRVVPEIAPRSSVIHPGLPIPAAAPAPLPFDRPLLLGLGRLVPEKGFDLALRAFSLVRERHPDVRLVVAGDGPVRGELEGLAESLGLTKEVEFAGWVAPDRVPDWINRALMLILPSRWQEPFGLVAVEAAQLARPVVAARVGGLKEIVVPGETGLLVRPEDITELASAVDSLLAQPALMREMGRKARKRAVKAFSVDRSAAEYDRLYVRLTDGRGG